MELFLWKCWNKVPLGIYFVESPGKKYGCEFIENKEQVWIYFIENAEIKYHWGFIFLKLLVKDTAVNLFKKKKAVDLFHWKSRNKVQLGIYFAATADKKYVCEIT